MAPPKQSSPTEAVASVERATEIIAVLLDKGFRTFYYAPGSRCAPFAYALQEYLCGKAQVPGKDADIPRVHVRIDERDAAFAALGSGRAGLPAVVIMTSGTAVGNCLCAVMEASHSAIPLVILSADRPAGLRGTGANQTTWQPGIFGRFVRFEADLQPEDSLAQQLAAVQSLSLLALGESEGSVAGPVHLNVSFAEPLAPAQVVSDFNSSIHRVQPAKTSTAASGLNTTTSPRVLDSESPRTVLVAGDLSQVDFRLWERCIQAQIPVLAEPHTQWRSHPNAVPAYARALDGGLAAQVQRVIVLGRPSLTRPVTRLISRRDVPVEVWDGPGLRLDPAGNICRRWETGAAIADSLSAPIPGWLESWREIGAELVEGLTKEWSIWQVAQRIWQAPGDLYLGSSLAIRAFDAVAGVGPTGWDPSGATRNGSRKQTGKGATDQTTDQTSDQAQDQTQGQSQGRQVWANRGLAGIDGLVASAWGAAVATGRLTRLVLGDISLWHDVGQLVHGKTEDTPNLQVIVLNNRGGRIFAGLEHGVAPPEFFERFFACEQIGHPMTVARMLGWPARTVEAMPQLADALDRYQGGLHLLEVWVK